MSLIADRVMQIAPSATMEMTRKARALKLSGYDVISLSVGEPDFDTPSSIQQAAIKAMQAGETRYTNSDGTPALKQAIIKKLARDNQLTYQPEQIIVSNGAKHSFFNLFQAILNPGDEIIVLAPYWVSYPDMAKLCDAKPVFIEAGLEQHFKIIPAQLSAAITPKTKLVIFNAPNNPSGKTYTKAEWQALAEVLLKHPHVLIATDDIYEHIYWGIEPFSNIINACPALCDRTLVINGVSKAYAMTGWRIGYTAGPKTIIAAMDKMQSQSTSNPCSISQAAAVAALNGDQSSIQPMCQAFKERHDFMVKRLKQIPGFECAQVEGAFYVFPRITGAMKRVGVENDIAFAEFLLEKALVAGVPGSAFGLSGYIRFSYATDIKSLNIALDRIEKLMKESV